MDNKTPEQRRKNMQAVRSSGSKIESTLGKALWNKGYRYRKNYKKLIGKPDIVFVRHKIAVFCDSEFWHGKDWTVEKQRIQTRKEFWCEKIESNIRRDCLVNESLRKQGWIVLRFWGNDILKNLRHCISVIENTITVSKNIS